MPDTEVITTVLALTIYVCDHHEKVISFMRSTGMIKHMLSKSRPNQLLYLIRELVVDLFFQLSDLIKKRISVLNIP